MLTITIGGDQGFDEKTDEFVSVGGIELELEHSLVSLSKWESKWNKPFLGKGEKSTEEVLDYIRCMIVTPNFPPEVLLKLSEDNVKAINEYLEAKMTATWFGDSPGAPGSRDVITSELIYYWMITFNIPFECQYWHLNRLFTLIRVCNAKQAKPKKMSRAEVIARQRQLNEERKKQLGTRG